jgi:hypothetical protein
MPIRIPRAAGAAAVAFLAIASSAAASPKTNGVDLRVVAGDGTELANLIQYTSTTRIPTDKHAKCFGPGTRGSGDPFTLRGATALGAIRDAMPVAPGLRPLSITDHFLDSFGPGICAIGGLQPPSTGYWDLRVNHADSTIGGGQPVADGDEVLWWEASNYPPGDELALDVPAGATPGLPVQVTVLGYDVDTGVSHPEQGASVDFAALPTDANGHTDVTFPTPGTAGVQARRSGDIPTTTYQVCVKANADHCPAAFGREIHGSRRGDHVATTPGDDFIDAAGGEDTVNIRKGGRDIVGCGGGSDRVVATKGDHDDKIGKSCEKVIRR